MRSTRRSYLAALGGTGALGSVAGCLGGSGGSGNLPDGCDVGTLDSVSSLPRPALGPEDAPVTVDVFEDFACPHCQTFTTSVYPEIKSNYVDSGDVLYRFFDFPIPVDETWSWAAASAARAVQDHGDVETFFTFTERVYENQGDLPDSGYQIVHDIANDLDVDGCTVAAAADQEPYREVAETDRETGSDRGVPGTPAVYVDGELLDNYGWESVSSAIDSRLDG
ncbi:DsbA family protein [Halobellus captivus]|uniref:DsbA family protein n=1 Tax=Halobellus captivus TaxID=2592614 RepID=UPI0011A3DCC8|nr:thioredoxin domain-containing protein [Halobellus captivus]